VITTEILETHSTVLVIDDDDYSQDLARLTLANLGYTRIEVACDGRIGLRLLDEMPQPPDFVICDIFMPETDGFEFVGELAKRRYTGGVILVTGGNIQMLHMARHIAVASGLNLLGAFTKPLQIEQLRQALSGSAST